MLLTVNGFKLPFYPLEIDFKCARFGSILALFF